MRKTAAVDPFAPIVPSLQTDREEEKKMPAASVVTKHAEDLYGHGPAPKPTHPPVDDAEFAAALEEKKILWDLERPFLSFLGSRTGALPVVVPATAEHKKRWREFCQRTPGACEQLARWEDQNRKEFVSGAWEKQTLIDLLDREQPLSAKDLQWVELGRLLGVSGLQGQHAATGHKGIGMMPWLHALVDAVGPLPQDGDPRMPGPVADLSKIVDLTVRLASRPEADHAAQQALKAVGVLGEKGWAYARVKVVLETVARLAEPFGVRVPG
ncbi:MAG: hypothetical protein IT384_34245 [Deltaproteobacteria bacterium]|nr:hypothetical protein [Deltaproteobacteria bacterium]